VSADINSDAVTAAIETIAALPPLERAQALERIALAPLGSITRRIQDSDRLIIEVARKAAEAKAARS
jgi:hypothetical protein